MYGSMWMTSPELIELSGRLPEQSAPRQYRTLWVKKTL
jgi:hypothetical protein